MELRSLPLSDIKCGDTIYFLIEGQHSYWRMDTDPQGEDTWMTQLMVMPGNTFKAVSESQNIPIDNPSEWWYKVLGPYDPGKRRNK
jgi:hypothetical protein